MIHVVNRKQPDREPRFEVELLRELLIEVRGTPGDLVALAARVAKELGEYTGESRLTDEERLVKARNLTDQSTLEGATSWRIDSSCHILWSRSSKQGPSLLFGLTNAAEHDPSIQAKYLTTLRKLSTD